MGNNNFEISYRLLYEYVILSIKVQKYDIYFIDQVEGFSKIFLNIDKNIYEKF